jgi:predicted metal-dependent hydrolase
VAAARVASFIRLRLPRRAILLETVPPSRIELFESTPLHVRVSTRARRIALRIDESADAIELVVPKGVSLKAAFRFVEQQRVWLSSQLAEQPPRIPFADGAEIPILGEPHRVCHLGPRWRDGTRIEDGEIRVGGEAPHVARRVRDALVALARHELASRSRALATDVDRRVTRVSVRDTKTRWGSCAASGALAFSWRLILAPEPVLDYVVAHEVAHLVHLNHGIRFWRLVERLAPGSARHRTWLHRNRSRLLRYG